MVVHGEAGVGKTRLVRETAHEAGIAKGRVLLGHCHPIAEPFPLGPVIEALGSAVVEPSTRPPSPLLGALRPLFPELAEHLPPVPPAILDPRAERHRLFRALRELLAAHGPTLCVLEDLHWADEATLEFVSFLASATPTEAGFVLTCRTEDARPSSRLAGLISSITRQGEGTSIGLAPLSVHDVRAMAASMLGSDTVTHEFARRLHEWTAGLPLAVEQVVRLLGDGGDVAAMMQCPAPASHTFPVPRAVGEPIVHRVQGLSDDARLVAWATAVLGVTAAEALILNVADLPPVPGASALVEALTVGALEERGNGLYGFRHGLATRAVYESIAGPRRRRLHLRAAAVLERRGLSPLAEIAHHLREGGSGKWPLYAEAAAEEASRAGDDRLAATLLGDALSASGLSREDRIRMVLALGEVALYGPPSPRVVRLLQLTLEEETLSPGVRGELRLSLSRLLGHAGDAASWRREAALAVAELRRRPALGVRAMVNLAQPLSHSDGKLDDHLAWLDRAVEAAERQTDRVARIAVSSQRAAILLSLGDRGGWAAVGDIPRSAATTDERLQLSRGYLALAETALGLGYYARAESFVGKADRIQDQIGHRSWGLWLEVTRASMDWCLGRWDGLEERLRRLLEETEPTPSLSLANRFALGSLLLSRGQLEEARRLLASSLEAAQRKQSLSQLVAVSGRLARLHLDSGDAHAARAVSAGALDAVRGKKVWVLGRSFAPEAVQALLGCGELDEARAVVAEFAAGLRGLDVPTSRAALSWCRGAVAEEQGLATRAGRHFERSEAGWGRIPNRYEAARALERRARCSPAEDGASADRLLLDALETFQDLGADGDARRVRAQLKARGAWRGGRTGYGDELSPREAQVARLAGRRKTNREIAEALFISPRTVEIHVAASLRKLDLRSRHELGEVPSLGKDT